ncbi:hypothetical protein [Fibrella forsythiae]|uniref:DUF5683 domain-containing protein n=1 Tax=Fibrella forsythiae TaxID=2817061 RepID=A0ABS3JSQ8_9BACT|nr:hypothetical protein [Fibrella forsythiae]MBO0952229.1 hypothetical protein [Fibrella forsythiae]
MRLFIFVVSLLTATLTYAQDNIILRNGEEIPAKVLEVTQTDLKYRKSANPDGPIYTSALRDVLLIKYANGTKDSFGNDRGPVPIRNRPGRPMPAEAGMAVAPAAPMQGLNGLRYHRGLFSRYYVGNNGQHIGVSEANSLFYSQPEAIAALERGRSLRTWSVVTAVSAGALIGTGVGLAIGRDGRWGRDNGPMGGNNNGNGPQFDGRRDGHRIGAALIGGGVLLGVASLWLDHRASVQFRRASDRYNNRQPTTLRFAPGQSGVGAILTF